MGELASFCARGREGFFSGGQYIDRHAPCSPVRGRVGQGRAALYKARWSVQSRGFPVLQDSSPVGEAHYGEEFPLGVHSDSGFRVGS